MLETDRLFLRELTLGDAERVEGLAGEYDVAKTTLNIPYPYPKGAAKSFITNVLDAEKEGKMAIYAIVLKADNRLIGIMSISINTTHDRGELAYWIGKPYWGKGYGTEAARELMRVGFEELHLNRIFAAAFTKNPGSWRIMEKIGMKYEGTLKHHLVKWGEYIDLAYYGILKEDYFQKKG